MKKWKDKTRDGTPVRIYAEDGAGRYPIHGAVFHDGKWHFEIWNKSGRADSGEECWADLIPNTPDIDWSKQPAWCKAIAMDGNGSWYRHDSVPVRGDSAWFGTYRPGYQMHPSEYPEWDGDWKDSLYVRPEGDPK